MSMYGFPVYDSDGHARETQADWDRLIPKADRQWGPQWVKDHYGQRRLVLGGQLWPKSGGFGTGHIPPSSDNRFFENGEAPVHRNGEFDPQQRFVDMETEGIDVAVLFGSPIFLSLPHVTDAKSAIVTARAYNNWMAEYCSADTDRLKGISLLPVQDLDEAVVELTRTVEELGFVGLALPGHLQGPRNLGDPCLYPLYQRAEDLGIPVCVHSGSGRPGAGADFFDNFFYVHAVTHPFEVMSAMMSIVCGGILDRFPTLKFVFLEAGCGWVPAWLDRLDEHYECLSQHVPLLKKPPSEAVREGQVWVSFEPEESALPLTIDYLGAEKLVFASDYNHFDGSFPNTVKKVFEREDLTDKQKRLLMHDNTRDLYKI